MKRNALAALLLSLAGAGAAHGQADITTLLGVEAGENFGQAVDLDGGIAIIGAPYTDGNAPETGAAYIYESDGSGGWTSTAVLVADDGTSGDLFGYTASIDGDVAIVGAIHDDDVGFRAGSTYVFERQETGWVQVQKLLAESSQDRFGVSVDLSGDVAVVGASLAEGGGAAYVYERGWGGEAWGLVRKLTASATSDFGKHVAVDGELAVIGAPGETADAGAAYVFARDAGGPDNWGEVERLTDAALVPGDLFGSSVAVSGDAVVVGAPRTDGMGEDSGSVFVFRHDPGDPTTWSLEQQLGADDSQAGDHFGHSVQIDGDTLIASSTYADPGGEDSGSAYIFDRTSGMPASWAQGARVLSPDPDAGDNFGGFYEGVCLSGSLALVGAPRDDEAGTDSGAVYVFRRGWPSGPACPGDLNGDGAVDVTDLLAVLAAWGSCP